MVEASKPQNISESEMLPQDTAKEFQESKYWSKFFKAAQERKGANPDLGFEWYAEFEDLQPFLAMNDNVTANMNVLVPGCGDSNLSEMLSTKFGLKQVHSIDFEADVIEKMKAKKVEGVTYEVMDFMDLKF